MRVSGGGPRDVELGGTTEVRGLWLVRLLVVLWKRGKSASLSNDEPGGSGAVSGRRESDREDGNDGGAEAAV